jgi:hypothetical protein
MYAQRLRSHWAGHSGVVKIKPRLEERFQVNRAMTGNLNWRRGDGVGLSASFGAADRAGALRVSEQGDYDARMTMMTTSRREFGKR